jgi:chromosome segregation ATPase
MSDKSKHKRIANLAKIQTELERTKARAGHLAPYQEPKNRITRIDLSLSSVYLIQTALTQAELTGLHTEQLRQIRNLSSRVESGLNAIAELPRQAPKYREQLESVYRELEQTINDLWNSTGFDLLDRKSWEPDTPN